MRRSTLPASYLEKEHALDRLRGRIFETHLRVLPDEARRSLNPAKASTHLLDVLALFYSVDFYRSDFDEESKRRSIGSSLALKRIKGTRAALEEAFEALGLEVDIEEWFAYGGEPFRFKLEVDTKSKEISSSLVEMLEEMVKEYKNVRSVLEEIRLAYVVQGAMRIGVGSVGEVCGATTQLLGYSEATQSKQIIHIGCVGEISSVAQQI